MGGHESTPLPVGMNVSEVNGMMERQQSLFMSVLAGEKDKEHQRSQDAAAQHAAILAKVDEERKATAALLQSAQNQQLQISKAADQRYADMLAKMNEERQQNKNYNEKMFKLQAQNLASVRNEEAKKLQVLMERMERFQEITKTYEKDKEEGLRAAMELQTQVHDLEKEKLDWKKAELDRTERLMRDTPPPFALKKKPPHNTPLFSEDYPCFAIVGKSGSGKSSLVNALTGTNARKVSSLTETTGYQAESSAKRQKTGTEGGAEMEPPPVFWTMPTGTEVALFDRPGVGAAIGGGPEFIQKQGLRYWTGVIVTVDSRAVAEEAKIYAICRELKTPVIVARNWVVQHFAQEKETSTLTGDNFNEQNAIVTIRDYLTEIGMEGEKALMVDTKHTDMYEFAGLKHWIANLSKLSNK